MPRVAWLIMSVLLMQQGFIPALAVQVGDDDETRMVSYEEQDMNESVVDKACIAEIAANGTRLVIGIVFPPLGMINGVTEFAAGSVEAARAARDLVSSSSRRLSVSCENRHKGYTIGKWLLGGVALGLGIAALVVTGGAAALGGAALGVGIGGFVAGTAETLHYKTWCETYQVAFEECLATGKSKGMSEQKNIDTCLKIIKGEVEDDAAVDNKVDADPSELPRIRRNMEKTFEMIEERLDSNWYINRHVNPISISGKTPTATFSDPPPSGDVPPVRRSRYERQYW